MYIYIPRHFYIITIIFYIIIIIKYRSDVKRCFAGFFHPYSELIGLRIVNTLPNYNAIMRLFIISLQIKTLPERGIIAWMILRLS